MKTREILKGVVAYNGKKLFLQEFHNIFLSHKKKIFNELLKNINTAKKEGTEK